MKGDLKVILKRNIIIRVGVLAFCLMALSEARAQQYPVQCFKGDELNQVQSWEANWVGKKISSANVDEVKAFLPESFYGVMKDTAKWGDSWFEIVAYKPVAPSPGTIEFTKKYYGQTKIGSNGEILNYVAGVPFPDTTNPLEMAHNFRMRNLGDSYNNHDTAFIVDGRLKYDMDSEIKNSLSFFAGRTDVQPVPEIDQNPKQIWRAFSMLQLAPPETRNMRIMEVHYKDTLKTYDSWFWMPSIRRVRRRSTSERQDAQGGADYCAFDNMGWDGPVQVNTYKYLGQRDLLMGRHTDSSKIVHTPGDCIVDGTQRERIKVHVIEATSKDPNFLYSKMVWYLDPESWQMLYSDRYDRGGKLWKFMDQLGFVGKGANNTEVAHFNASQTIDLQRIHATSAKTEYEFGAKIEPEMYTLDYLQKHGY